MKAIVNVKKSSYQAINNGLTFEVKELLDNIVAIDIPSKNGFTTTDFTFKEVLIVDIETELDIAFRNLYHGLEVSQYERLCKYVKQNNIKTKKL